MKIERIEHLDFIALEKILASNKLTDRQKELFINNNKNKIEKIVIDKISSTDFKTLMQNRNLEKFRPLKNSFTKKGDKLILAKALGIKPSEVSDYVKNVKDAIQDINSLSGISPEKINMLKTYVYRHGSKDELVAFLDYELNKTKDIEKTLYRTLQYYSGGVADYFIRPIHRMDNKTLIKIYKTINKNIKLANTEGRISDAQSEKYAKWALIQIYKIQNNSKFINAIKTYRTLK
jgi:hypothetical protein